jgi:peptidylprolyl isomerase
VVSGLACAAAGCGASRAPGIDPAPSAGLTQAPATTSAPAAALPSALATKPRVIIPAGPPPRTLKVTDLIKGAGAAATAQSTVTVQYVGILYKGGKQFDASWNDGSGQPIALSLGHVIAGWRLGIPGMRVGGRRELIVPAALAYGKKGRPPLIPQNAPLVFVIDLHAIS